MKFLVELADDAVQNSGMTPFDIADDINEALQDAGFETDLGRVVPIVDGEETAARVALAQIADDLATVRETIGDLDAGFSPVVDPAAWVKNVQGFIDESLDICRHP